VVQDQSLDELGMRMVTLQAPPGMTARRALQRLRGLDRNGSYDYNHVYTQSTADEIPSGSSAISGGISATHVDSRVGLIDGGVEATHPVFHSNRLSTWGCDQQVIPSAHGTAVASLLVGRSERFSGAAPAARDTAVCIAVSRGWRALPVLAWLAQQQCRSSHQSGGTDNAVLDNWCNLNARGHIQVSRGQ
jgi:hypothetical protein